MSPSRLGLPYTLAAVAGAMSSFELVASMLASNGRHCGFVLLNTVRIPSTVAEYLDNRSVKRSDEPLWINDFVVEYDDANYFCKDTGLRWVLPLIIYVCSVAFLYQRFRGNQLQNFVIGFHIVLGAMLGALAGLNVKDIFTGIVPVSAWTALVCMPLHIEHNWKEKQGTLRFE